MTVVDSTSKLVRLDKYVPHIKTDFVYATPDNFTKTVLYHHPLPLAIVAMAQKLRQAAIILEKQGLGILIFDAYRPYAVTKKMWAIVPDDRYAANPANGSDHNRGAAVDLSLYDLKTGKKLLMPTGFDNFTEKAHHGYMQLPEDAIQNRALLKKTMEAVGLLPLSTEWWHYYLPERKKYPILNIDFFHFAD